MKENRNESMAAEIFSTQPTVCWMQLLLVGIVYQKKTLDWKKKLSKIWKSPGPYTPQQLNCSDKWRL